MHGAWRASRPSNAPGSIGPVDPITGRSLGGTLKYTGRAELELPLISRLGISAVAFVEGGGIYAAGAGGAGVSAGIGLLWRSPIGPVRLDLAFQLGRGRSRAVVDLGDGF